MTASPRLTICTPTFNRAHTIERVYASIIAQTRRDFEWLVVDDGSTDDTPAVLAAWAASAPFPMRVIRQTNSGKQAAVRTGVGAALGEFVLIADSDDAFEPETVERFLATWDEIPAADRERFAGIGCRCKDERGRLIGAPFPTSPFDASFAELLYRYHLADEKWWMVRTALLRASLLPTSLGTGFFPENLVWLRIARTHTARFINDPLRTYYRDDATGSLMRTPAHRVARGMMLLHQMMLNEELPRWGRVAPAEFLRSAVHYGRFCRLLGLDRHARRAGLAGPGQRLLVAAAAPVAAVVAWRDRRLAATAAGGR